MARKRPFLRTDRLASQIHQTLATAVQRESREAILRAIVFTEVSVTSDLSLARVYWHALPGEAEHDREAVEAALGRANGFLRARVAEAIRARKLPELRFMHDDALDHGRHIESILGEIAATRPDDADSNDVAASEGDATLPGPASGD